MGINSIPAIGKVSGGRTGRQSRVGRQSPPPPRKGMGMAWEEGRVGRSGGAGLGPSPCPSHLHGGCNGWVNKSLGRAPGNWGKGEGGSSGSAGWVLSPGLKSPWGPVFLLGSGIQVICPGSCPRPAYHLQGLRQKNYSIQLGRSCHLSSAWGKAGKCPSPRGKGSQVACLPGWAGFVGHSVCSVVGKVVAGLPANNGNETAHHLGMLLLLSHWGLLPLPCLFLHTACLGVWGTRNTALASQPPAPTAQSSHLHAHVSIENGDG